MKNIIKYLFLTTIIFINNGVNAEMAKNTIITIKTTSGNIKLELFDDKAPITSENFKQYIKSGYFTNSIFHRVIKDFMIQGGGFTPEMQEKETLPPITNEAHSASAQFFINLKDNLFLDFKSETIQGWGYCVFGKVIEGIETIDKIALVDTGSYGPHQDVPNDPIIINEIIIE